MLFGCEYQSRLVDCMDGRVCPAETVCVPESVGGCAEPEQLTACNAVPEGGTCEYAGFDGRCRMGVCVPSPPRYRYVVDRMFVPTTNSEAASFGLDLNDDGVADNALGRVTAALASMGLDAQPAVTSSIDRGEAITLLLLATAGFITTQESNAMVLVGSLPNPTPCVDALDTICRRHLDGNAMFVASAGDVTLLDGGFVNGTLTTNAGHYAIPLSILSSDVVMISLIGARLRIMADEATITSMHMGGAIAKDEIDGTLMPAIQQGAMKLVMRDCTMLSSPPNCGCAPDSQGKSMIGVLDTAPSDCDISFDEVRDNSLFTALFAPDIMIEGQMAISFGLMARGVRASFEFP